MYKHTHIQCTYTLYMCIYYNVYIHVHVCTFKYIHVCNYYLFLELAIIFMARRAIPMIAFPRVRCMFIYIFSCVHLREYALYT